MAGQGVGASKGNPGGVQRQHRTGSRAKSAIKLVQRRNVREEACKGSSEGENRITPVVSDVTQTRVFYPA